MNGLQPDETVVDGPGREASPATSTPADAGGAGASPPPQALADAGAEEQRIGRYEIRGLLGRGGMGSVFRAFDPVLEREVAVKVMLAELVGDPEQKQRFEREARAVARLSHPGVVTVFDLGYHTDGSPYIVMELLRGRDLLARVRADPPLSLDEKVEIVSQVLGGLGHAHRAGIVHRDIKPANVFLTEDGVARIMDFGLAFFTASGATSRSIMGTVAYMSTEQVRGERVDGRSDLFSVGTLLCELLTGRRPFEAETPGATLYKIAHEQPRIELPSAPESQRFLPVLRRALANKADDRYQTAAEFAAALRACREPERLTDVDRREPVQTREPPPAHERAAKAPGAAAMPPSPAPSPAPPPTAAAAPAPSPGSEPRADPSGLFKLLRDIYVGGKTGQLHFAIGANRKSLRILRGQILHGTSDEKGEHLGDVLVRYGLLLQTDLERAVAVVLSERKRLGAVLGGMGLIEAETLQEAVGIHVREILFSALDRADASFSFEELAETSLDTDLVCPQSMGQVILEATRRVFDPSLVRRILGDTSRVLRLSPDPLLRTQKITLTPADGFVLSRVDGVLAAREIIDLIPLPAEDSERSLFSLLCTGIVGYELPAPRHAPSGDSTSPLAARRGATVGPKSAPAPAPRSTPSTPSPTPPAPAVPPPPSEPARVLAKPSAPSAPAPPAPAATAAATAPGGLGAAQIRVILEASTQARRDPFEVLGLEPTADDAAVRTAYARLARVLHPDAALDPSLEDLRHLRQGAFVQLGQAVDLLRSPVYRKYAAEKASARVRATAKTVQETRPPADSAGPPPAPSRPSPEPAVSDAAPRPDPEAVLKLARKHFENESYWDTIQLLEPLLPVATANTRTQVRMLLAQSYVKNPKWRKRAEEGLLELVRELPQYLPAHLLLADIYRSSGLAARARATYQKVLALQPENETAARALAELEPPPPEPPPAGGLRGMFKRR